MSDRSQSRISHHILETLPFVGTTAVLFVALFYGGYALAVFTMTHAQELPGIGLGYFVGFGAGAAFASILLYAAVKLAVVDTL